MYSTLVILAALSGLVAAETRPLPGQLGRWQVTERLRLGSGSDVTFGQVGDIALAPGGTMFVLDRLDATIYVFDSTGTLVRQFGRPGSGPGEFTALTSALILRDSLLIVPDPGNARVVVLDTLGNLAGGFRLKPEISLEWAGGPGITLVQRVDPPLVPLLRSPGTAPGHPVLLKRTLDGRILDTVTTFPTGPPVRVSGSNVPEVHVFIPQPVWATDAIGRVLTAVNTEYVITVHAPRVARQRWSRVVERRVLSRRDRERLRDRYEATARTGAGRDLMRNLVIGDAPPVISAITAGPGQTILVRRAVGLIDGESPPGGYELVGAGPVSDWDVWSQNGSYEGVLSLPTGFVPMAAHGARLVGAAVDGSGASTVVVLEVSGPA